MGAVAVSVTICGGQGARRKANWRHNQPNSPYRRALVAAYEEELKAREQGRLQEQKERKEQAAEEPTPPVSPGVHPVEEKPTKEDS